jgi:hypothetical protein
MEKLTIFEEECQNKCTLCNRDFKWKYYYHPATRIAELPLKEFEFITEHATCRSLMRRQRETKDKLLGIEFQIWEKKYFI